MSKTSKRQPLGHFLGQPIVNSHHTIRRLLEYRGQLVVGEFVRVDVVEKLSKICRSRSKTGYHGAKCVMPYFPVWREKNQVWNLGLIGHSLIISPFHNYVLVFALETDRHVLPDNVLNNPLFLRGEDFPRGRKQFAVDQFDIWSYRDNVVRFKTASVCKSCILGDDQSAGGFRQLLQEKGSVHLLIVLKGGNPFAD